MVDGDENGWFMAEPYKKGSMYSNHFLDTVENWILEGNEKVKVSPCKNDLLILHDREGMFFCSPIFVYSFSNSFYLCQDIL